MATDRYLGNQNLKAAGVSVPFTEEEVQEYLKCSKDPVYFIKKYIKIVENGGGVKAFVVGVENDKRFKLGDILLPAGYNAPARNFARGNILDGGYNIGWTGPLYGTGTPR